MKVKCRRSEERVSRKEMSRKGQVTPRYAKTKDMQVIIQTLENNHHTVQYMQYNCTRQLTLYIFTTVQSYINRPKESYGRNTAILIDMSC